MSTPRDFKTIVGEAIGRASVCWSELPSGVFDSTNAKQLADAIVAEYDELKAENERLDEKCKEMACHTYDKGFEVIKLAEQVSSLKAENERLTLQLIERNPPKVTDALLRLERDKLVEQVKELQADLEIVKFQKAEMQGYLEGCQEETDELAEQVKVLKEVLERIADRNAHGVMVTIAREALKKLERKS